MQLYPEHSSPSLIFNMFCYVRNCICASHRWFLDKVTKVSRSSTYYIVPSISRKKSKEFFLWPSLARSRGEWWGSFTPNSKFFKVKSFSSRFNSSKYLLINFYGFIVTKKSGLTPKFSIPSPISTLFHLVRNRRLLNRSSIDCREWVPYI